MSRLISPSGLSTEQVELRRASPRRASATVLHCLVVSARQRSRDLLSAAAARAGWDTVVRDGPATALAACVHTRFQLALVDVVSDRGRRRAFRELCQAIVAHIPVVGICGQVDSPEEELWARQLGSWLYLPGVASSSEVSLLCEQAKEVVNKLARVHSQKEVPSARRYNTRGRKTHGRQ